MSDWAMEKARKIAWNDILGYSLETTHNAEVIATALREAEARGRASVREDAAKVATSFLVGDPFNGVPLRSPMAHEIADAILALS